MSKGKKKPKISDISRTPPTQEELNKLHEILGTKIHPLAAAILGAVALEHELEAELRRRLRCSNERWVELVSDIGPLRSFHNKIAMAQAMRIFDEGVRRNFDIVRNIRNQFAHSKKLITFDNKLILDELKKANKIPGCGRKFKFVSDNKSGPQFAYISLCMLLIIFIMKQQTKAARRQVKWLKKRVKKQGHQPSPTSLAIARLLMARTKTPELSQLSPLPNQSGDPKHATQQLSHLGLMGLGAEYLRNEDI